MNLSMAGATDNQNFEARLADGFQSLLSTSGNSSYFSLPWIQQALQFISETHNTMHALVPLEKFLCRERDEKWLRSCISDMEKMQQVCGILIKSISDLRYYQMIVQLALQSVQSNQTHRAQQMLNSCMDPVPGNVTMLDFPENETSRLSLQRARLENCKDMLLGVLEGEIFPCANSEAHLPILYGMRTSAVFVLLVLVACLAVRPKEPAPESDVQIRSALSNYNNWEETRPAWFTPMMDLFRSLKEEIIAKNSCRSEQKPFAFLQELDQVDESLRQLGNLMRQPSANTSDIERSAMELKCSVEKIESKLPEIEAQVNGMNKMITSSRAIALRLLLTSST